MSKKLIGNYSIELVEGDITLLETDAIVNAANTDLILGAGVAGAIRKRGGSSIQEECNEIAPIRTGEAVLTTGGDLKAKYVVHTAGPVYHQYSSEKAERLLALSVKNSLSFLRHDDINSIAFPAISAGIYGFPNAKCATIMLTTIKEYAQRKNKENSDDHRRKRLVICLYDQVMYDLFKNEMKKVIK